MLWSSFYQPSSETLRKPEGEKIKEIQLGTLGFFLRIYSLQMPTKVNNVISRQGITIG